MKHLTRKIFVVFSLITISIWSCNQSPEKYIKLEEERDSLKAETQNQVKYMNSIVAMIDTINSVLDSITREEGVLFLTPTQEVRYSKTKKLQDLNRFKYVLRHQQKKIDELDSLLSSKEYFNQRSMQVLMTNLRIELEKKDIQIEKLRSELSKKDFDIKRLRKEVQDKNKTISEHEETINQQDSMLVEQNKIITHQDEMLNYCYILIASNKDLADKGIITKKKLLKESRLLNERELDDKYFHKVDIRQCLELSFNAKDPRILTNMPKSSYSLQKINKGEYLLSITDVTSFWSISNYLVIQTD